MCTGAKTIPLSPRCSSAIIRPRSSKVTGTGQVHYTFCGEVFGFDLCFVHKLCAPQLSRTLDTVQVWKFKVSWLFADYRIHICHTVNAGARTRNLIRDQAA